MKRFAVFAGDAWYPSGGWQDFRAAFDTLDEAKNALLNSEKRFDWFDIVDLEEGKVVACSVERKEFYE